MINTNYSDMFGSGTTVDEGGNPFRIEIDNRLRWISMIDRLASGDITRHDEIYKKNYIECLNLMSFWHQRDRYQEQLRKEQEMRSKMFRK